MVTHRNLIAFLLLVSLVFSLHVYQRYENSVNPEAKCLDGSTPILYVQQGSAPTNFIIYLTG